MSNAPNPFADRENFAPPPRTTRSPMAIVGVILGVMFLAFVCLAAVVGTGVYKHARPTPVASLPPRNTDLQEEFADYKASVESAFESGPSIDSLEIENTLLAAIDRARRGETVSVNVPMFIEAVMRSPYAEGMDFGDQLVLRNTLSIYPPEMYASDHEAILAVRADPENDKLATADVLLYSTDDPATSLRIYLVRTGRGWEHYDVLDLENGLRTSDEYASYFASDDDSGMLDSAEVIEMVEEATSEYYDGDADKAFTILRRAENQEVEAASRLSAKLQVAYGWMNLDEYGEAERVLLSIEDPDACWGIWPTLAICRTYMDDYEQA
ncbi:MAG: hypothetical protein AAFX06_15675 [Planctomycetota bacterium]